MSESTTSRKPVEAGSLSSLTALAADPPLNPRQPFAHRSEPLTLYLARVPGSRDVFLTPLKPRTKTVTAQDVESCLYYMHFESAQDSDVLSTFKPGQRSSAVLHPQRRPLPATPENEPPLTPRPRDVKTDHARSPISQSSIRRKPVMTYARPALNESPAASLSQRPTLDTDSPPLPPRPASGTSHRDLNVPSAMLVRRDPSSGQQWNVAKVLDPPVHNVVSTPTAETAPPRQTGSPMHLELYGSGYCKFVSAATTPALPPASNRSTRGTPESGPSLESPNTTVSAVSGPGDNALFRRRMWLEGSHFLGGRNRYRHAADVDRSDFVGGTLQVPEEGRLRAHGDRRSTVKGYAFLSPWQGRCEFATSKLGSSLKCRHRLPGSNELASVSELRFNLPSRPGHRKSSSYSAAMDPSLQLSQHTRDRRAHSVSSLGDEFEGIDLSLGQELAGGGATGKQAKLGKLIIEPEGLQMLDLIVAANMGLWWRAYGHGTGHNDGPAPG